jgi:ribulose-phosphate 3-epimerase
LPSDATFARLEQLTPAISVGLLSANLMALGADLQVLERAGVGLAHIDVMDGRFTPMLTVGPPFVKAVRTSLLKDVHLMIGDPLDRLADYGAAGADILTVHHESCVHIHRVLQQIGTMAHADGSGRRIVRGLAINPGTPVGAVEPLLDQIDMVTLLGINPGWGGQGLLPSIFPRLEEARRLVASAGRRILVAVDGGVTQANIASVAAGGADVIVTGSAVFDGKQPAANAELMLRLTRQGAASRHADTGN